VECRYQIWNRITPASSVGILAYARVGKTATS
jgi:hypothetical protein